MTFLACALACGFSPMAAQAHELESEQVPEQAQPDTLDQQLALFLEWFPGRFDSAPQVEEEAAAGLPEDKRNYRRHSIFARADLPQFGENTIYAEQRRWLPGAPPEGTVYRQRVYVIALDEEAQAIRLTVHVPQDQAALLGAYRDPSLLADLTPADTAVWDGCDLLWQWQGDRFRGEIAPGACRFNSPAYGQEIVLEEYLVLSADAMQFADRGLSLEGEYLFGMRGDTPNISSRMSPLGCTFGDASGSATPQPDCSADREAIAD